MKNLIFIILCILSQNLMSQVNSVGIFQNRADIGSPKNTGSAKYDAENQNYTLQGSGYNIWFNRDELFFLYNQIKGDFILTADFEFVGEGKDPHRKIGWMVRQSKDEDAIHICATVHGDGLTVLQWRELKGAFMRDPEDEIFSLKKNLQTLQLERIGKKFIMRVANWGEPLQLVGTHELSAMSEEVLAGLFICSHNVDAVEEARIWNVRIDKPVPDNYNPSKDGFLSSRLEIMNPFDGKRKVIHEHSGRFEAPNWMPDGKKLLYNQDGLLYKIPIAGGTPEKINTEFANRNNNDHGISFDGKTLAISHHREGLPGGGSTIYVLPLAGGTPKQVTQLTPSYWHGWHANNKEVFFVGQRNGSSIYNIYKANIQDGSETALTMNKSGHVDGPEGSPDGKYVYYNGNQTGTMQLWRMKSDGTNHEQLTFDEYHNWFPHISPDGKWIAFLSFLPEINPNDHPTYKRVMLRMMPAMGGAPRVIAHLFGGQGTINVPSWSPDSRQIAFVSYTK